MTVNFTNDWNVYLEKEFSKPYYSRLKAFLTDEYNNETVYPPMYDIFNALHTTSYNEAKVVILGQDPYHGPNQAHGYSFSVQPGVKVPPSLKNIYKELQSDVGITIPNHGCLKSWADQGVLLLNTVLTVRAHEAHSHRGKGWEQLTDRIIDTLNQRDKPLVFILWGKPAQQKLKQIDQSKHLILTAPHPSPLSAHRGFFGSRHFSKANAFLVSNEEEPVNWQLPLMTD